MIFAEEFLNKNKFISSNLVFDFTRNSPITYINFLSDTPGIHKSLERRAELVLEAYPDVNYVVVCGQKEDTTFRANWDGIPGLLTWDDPFYLGKLLHELVYVRNNTKYSIAHADCAGAYTLLFAAKNLHLNFIFFTTPVVGMIPEDNQYRNTFSQRTTDLDMFKNKHGFISGLENRCVIFEKGSKYEEYFDALPLLQELINSGTKIEAHWSTNVVGIDKFEKERIEKLQSLNLKVVLHDIPPTMHPHLLNKFLYETSKLKAIIQSEVDLGKIYCQTSYYGLR